MVLVRPIKEESKGCTGLHGLVAASTEVVLNHPCPVVTYNSDSLEAGAVYHFCITDHSVHAKPNRYFLDLWVVVGSAEFPFCASLLSFKKNKKTPQPREVSLTYR